MHIPSNLILFDFIAFAMCGQGQFQTQNQHINNRLNTFYYIKCYCVKYILYTVFWSLGFQAGDGKIKDFELSENKHSPNVMI
jgi:hypothetical protein